MSHHHPCHTHDHGHDHCCHGEHCSCCGHVCSTYPHHTHEEGGFAQDLLEMADQAWMEVLKEKMKEQILASSGKYLDDLAKTAVESNKSRWKSKKAAHYATDEFKAKVNQLFTKE